MAYQQRFFLFALGLFLCLSTQVSAATPKKYSTQTGMPTMSAPTSKTTSKKIVREKVLLSSKAQRKAPKTVIPAPKVNGVPIYANALLVVDQSNHQVLLTKNPQQVMPLASLTKLMTAMVLEDAKLSDDEVITIGEEDIDLIKNSHSRLMVGLPLRRADALLLALMASDNRAAHALGRHYPGGVSAFVMAMNQKAAMLGMHQTRFVDPTGLSPNNVSSPNDIVLLVNAASQYENLRNFSTMPSALVHIGEQTLAFHNTNPLIKNSSDLLNIKLSKTGHINEAGFCLAFLAMVNAKPITVVIMAAKSKSKRFQDMMHVAEYIRKHVSTL